MYLPTTAATAYPSFLSRTSRRVSSISGTQIFTLSALLVSGVLFGVGIAHQVFAAATETYPMARSGDARLLAGSPMLEMHIANSGAVLLRGARITALSSTNIRASLEWGPAVFSWNIPANTATQFINSRGEKMERSDLRIGDFVTISGELASGSGNIVNATYVRSSTAAPTTTVFLNEKPQ